MTSERDYTGELQAKIWAILGPETEHLDVWTRQQDVWAKYYQAIFDLATENWPLEPQKAAARRLDPETKQMCVVSAYAFVHGQGGGLAPIEVSVVRYLSARITGELRARGEHPTAL